MITSTKKRVTATISELAQENYLNPCKLLVCIRETFPQAEMNSPITAGALDLAFANYKKIHDIQPGGPAPKTFGSDPASPGTREQFQSRGNTMTDTDNDDFYDEHATDAESTKQWAADQNIRAEFHSDYESFKHFRRAEAQGLIRILGGI